MVIIHALAGARRMVFSGLSSVLGQTPQAIELPTSNRSSRQSEKGFYDEEGGGGSERRGSEARRQFYSEDGSKYGMQFGEDVSSPRPRWSSSNASNRQLRQQIARGITLLLAFALLYGFGRLLASLFEFQPGALQKLQRNIHWLPTENLEVVSAATAIPAGVTIVSAFFLVSDGKKHSVDEYYHWIANFLEHVEQPIVFFTSPDLVDMVIKARAGLPIHVISDYQTAWEMPPIEQLGGHLWGDAMNRIDPEAFKHVSGVYGPWTAKPWMVQHAKDINLYNSKYFFWMDAGGFREFQAAHHLRALPDRLDEIYATVPNNTIVLGDANLPWPDGTDYVKQATLTGEMDRGDCHIQGGWFGGTAEALDWWESETIKVTTIQAGLQRFSGKEQDTWTHTARLHWKKIYVMKMFFNNGNCGYDPWFAYEYWSDGKFCEIEVWNGPELWKAEQPPPAPLNLQAAQNATS